MIGYYLKFRRNKELCVEIIKEIKREEPNHEILLEYING